MPLIPHPQVGGYDVPACLQGWYLLTDNPAAIAAESKEPMRYSVYTYHYGPRDFVSGHADLDSAIKAAKKTHKQSSVVILDNESHTSNRPYLKKSVWFKA